MDLKQTVNLPKTDFAQKGNLPVREPERLDAWRRSDIYGQIRLAREGRPRYNLHDGPPYANGNIHLGHALNKILKDLVIKMKTMEGYDAPYVPGWDCHGLPIEKQVEKNLEKERKKRHELPVAEFRRLAREYAAKYVDIQSAEFQRLGVFGDWEHPYLTMDYTYEADTVRAIGKFMAEGSVYKGPRPVQWCIYDQTALAEAEVEFKEHASPSVYVAFPLVSDATGIDPALAGRDVSVVIWTTTPWTLPANLAVAFNPELDYVAVEPAESGGKVFILAQGLLETVAGKLGWTKPAVLATFKGEALDRLIARHPFVDRESLFVLADYVTLDAGTGAVHTAPGHGHDDYLTGQRYELEVYCPVDHAGRFTADVEHFAGQRVFDANAPIIELLRERGALLAQEKVLHSYAHCWRCSNPLIYRATPQWFVSMDNTNLRSRATEAVRGAEWIPKWGEDRMVKMIENRPDWCISRQRAWGVPIPAFYCAGCDGALVTPEIVEHVAQIFERESADAWYARDAVELLPPGTVCPGCGGADFRKETDILDVWIDSGASSLAVVERRGLGWPADMYLEGNDQFRGWFNSSLMVGVETRGAAPYKTVLIHGMTVDEKGEKLSKSKGNAPDLDKIVKANGVELLRLWVASVNYREELPWSQAQTISRLSEAYRKIRNTARYALGNLDGFDPVADRVPYGEMLEFDRWALTALNRLTRDVREAYAAYEFHAVYHALYNFCTIELSSIYFDVLKDRLYTHAPHSLGRRSAQTALYEILDRFTKLIAPILVFTAEEILEHMPGATAGGPSVHVAEFPNPEEAWDDAELEARWARLLAVRETGQKALEEKRAAKEIGSSLEAIVTIAASGADAELLAEYRRMLEDLLIVSGVELVTGEGEGVAFTVRKSESAKCERCWHYRDSVGSSEGMPTVCGECREHLAEGWPELVTA